MNDHTASRKQIHHSTDAVEQHIDQSLNTLNTSVNILSAAVRLQTSTWQTVEHLNDTAQQSSVVSEIIETSVDSLLVNKILGVDNCT